VLCAAGRHFFAEERSMKRAMMLALGLGMSAVVGFGCGGGGTGVGGPGGGSKRLTGGGSTFIEQMMKVWNPAYAKAHGVEVDYSGTGSGNGITSMTDRKNDFGCTDAPMTEEQMQKAKSTHGDVLHVPLVMGAVVPIYNLPEVEQPVKFTGPVLAKIYLGEIKKWNDPELAKVNDGVMLPDLDITVNNRSDASGTSFIFTDYLSKVSPEWEKKVGRSTSPKWPVGVGAPRSQGVAGAVQTTPGSIGYVELIYALSEGTKIKYGPVQNKEGVFVLGSLESVTAAAANLKDVPDNLAFSLTNADGKDSYPISGTTWMVLYENQPKDKAKPLTDYVRWLTHEGQDMCKEKHYARLPKGIVDKIDKKVELIKAE
jgi:phosphate transport system substrate-binding protein